jgi:hypothetical protein
MSKIYRYFSIGLNVKISEVESHEKNIKTKIYRLIESCFKIELSLLKK